MTRIAALLSCLALVSCASAAPPNDADANREVTLIPGESVFLEKKMPVRLASVVEDSRCPKDTTCVWAGEVRILLDGSKALLRPTYLRPGESTTIDKYQVTLVRVEPQPVSTAKIEQRDYRVTLRVAH